jgi:hypothetical protein
MFTSSLDKTIRLWTISTGSVLKTIKSPAIFDEPILCMSLHSNAIAIGGSGGTVQVLISVLVCGHLCSYARYRRSAFHRASRLQLASWTAAQLQAPHHSVFAIISNPAT